MDREYSWNVSRVEMGGVAASSCVGGLYRRVESFLTSRRVDPHEGVLLYDNNVERSITTLE